MPIVDPNDPQVWEVHTDPMRGQWNVGTGFMARGSAEVRVGYVRALHGPGGQAGKRAAGLIKALNLTAADNLVLPGDNSGWVAEALTALGINAVAADNGTLNQQRKAETETAMIRARIVAAGLGPGRRRRGAGPGGVGRRRPTGAGAGARRGPGLQRQPQPCPQRPWR